MITFIKNQFLSVVIIILLFVLMIDRCSRPMGDTALLTVVRDTVYIPIQGTSTSHPTLVGSVPVPLQSIIKEIHYLPDTTYKGLVNQYRALLLMYFAKNIEKDTLRIDSIGSVFVTDTVSKNLLLSRTYHYDLKYPVITNTVTLPYKSKNQLYGGGFIQGSPITLVQQINAGVMLKTRKDQLYGFSVGTNKNLQLNYQLSTYWKINLKRK